MFVPLDVVTVYTAAIRPQYNHGITHYSPVHMHYLSPRPPLTRLARGTFELDVIVNSQISPNNNIMQKYQIANPELQQRKKETVFT